jgi:hypothetical protein
MHKFSEIIENIENSDTLNFNQSFEYAQYCSFLLKTEPTQGRELIIYILENWIKISPDTKGIWSDLVELAGFYPYTEKEIVKDNFTSLTGQIRKGNHTSEFLKGLYFHEAQKELAQILHSDKNLIVSAPTSFGKSLLIEEMIASKRYRNIIIIQPTLALVDETRKKMLKYNGEYNIVVRTSQNPSLEKGNIFLFTAERVCEYHQFPNIEFLVIDEFYKLSGTRDDERSSALNNAFHFLLKSFNPKFYLLGPNIDSISPGFTEKYNAIFYKSDFSLVTAKENNIYTLHKNEFGDRGPKKVFKENKLFELLFELKEEQTIIYCSSPIKVRKLAKAFMNFLKTKEHSINHLEEIPLIQWIKENIAIGWSLSDKLEIKIGIHDGALQKHITSSVIDYFNSGKLSWLFCTSTIIEGVNTSAKNIVYFDKMKGPNPVDFFDYSNIKGRAGRMMEHFIGTIYNFNPPPKNELVIVDIPFFQQSPIKDEVLIQLDDEEIIDRTTEQFKSINTIPILEKELFKKNGVKVEGQITILNKLRSDILSESNLICWNAYPTYEQLTYVLTLAHENLLVEGESRRPSISYLINRTFSYGINKSVKDMIFNDFVYSKERNSNPELSDIDIMDDSIKDIFQLIKHWFQYKIPKLLSVVNEIQKFVCEEHGIKSGNYSFYINLIENDFLRDNLTILYEYGIPSSAIRKLEGKIPANIPEDKILQFIKQNNLHLSNEIIAYEKVKITENL